MQSFTSERSAGSNSNGINSGDGNDSGSSDIRRNIGGVNCIGWERRMIDITRDKPIKVAVKVQVPVQDHPKFNFVGKLLGPKGNSLKRLQEESGCKMAVLGRGSMKDRQKEEELRVSSDPKFSHLNHGLHVEISAYATPAEAYARIAYALVEVRRFLVPDHNDDIRQEQMLEIQMMNCSENNNNPQDAPSSPNITSEPSESLMSSITDHITAIPPMSSIDNQESHNKSNSSSIAHSISPTIGRRKRPLVPTNRPTKRTVMSLLARARTSQNKERNQVSQIIHNQSQSPSTAAAAAAIHKGTLTMLAQSTCQATIIPSCQRIQLIGPPVVPMQNAISQ